MKNNIETYLDYLNNYVSRVRMAEDYELDVYDLSHIITQGMYENNLLFEFNNMDKLHIFEIEEESGDYEIFEVTADTNGLSIKYTDIGVKWDYVFSLDEHLETLYALCLIELQKDLKC